MFPPATLLVFGLGAFGLIASPGPDFLYVLTRGIAQGRRAGWLSACGIALGLLVHTTLAVIGLTALLQTSPRAFNAVKWGGAVYLIYLGIKVLRSKESFRLDSERPPVADRAVLWQGFLTNVLNPKAALTFALFLPQFVRVGTSSTRAQIAALGLMMAGMAWLWFSFVGSFAGSVGGFLRRRPRAGDVMRLAAGTLFVLLGLYVLLEVRPAGR